MGQLGREAQQADSPRAGETGKAASDGAAPRGDCQGIQRLPAHHRANRCAGEGRSSSLAFVEWPASARLEESTPLTVLGFGPSIPASLADSRWQNDCRVRTTTGFRQWVDGWEQNWEHLDP
jgi:hypothetical protein